MPTRILVTTALLVGLAAALPSAARADAVADAVGAIEASVQDVRIAGSWEQDGRKGVFRVVVARAGLPQTARLFVQWIATGVDGSEALVRSVEIAEMQSLKLDIADFVAETDPDGLTVFVEVVDPKADTDQSYELFVEHDGSYRFGPASN